LRPLRFWGTNRKIVCSRVRRLESVGAEFIVKEEFSTADWKSLAPEGASYRDASITGVDGLMISGRID
jgi:hypothetical protein